MPYVYRFCVPVLDIPYGLLAVPLQRYLERGTLFYAAETASPISLGRRKDDGEWRHDGVSRVAGSLSRRVAFGSGVGVEVRAADARLPSCAPEVPGDVREGLAVA